jgi:hypothetical protein
MGRRRDCVGKTLANVVVLATLVRLVGHYRFRIAEELVGSPDQVENDKVLAPTLSPGNGLWMYAEPRGA